MHGRTAELGQLQRERPNAGIVFVAADPVPIEKPQIAAAVAKARIGAAENWMFAHAFGDRLRYEVNPAWAGELPYIVMIDREGKASLHLRCDRGRYDPRVVGQAVGGERNSQTVGQPNGTQPLGV